VFDVAKSQGMSNKYPQITVRLCARSLKELEHLSMVRRRTRSEMAREAIHYYYQFYSKPPTD